MIKILFAASEAVPFIKTGGLADVTGSLPKYFDREHCDVRIILPKYLCMDEQWRGQLQFLCHFYVNLSWRKQYVGIFQAKIDGIIYYFVDNEYYFAGDKPYNRIYEDVEKFAYFSKAVLAALPYLNFCPNVIHCHDWQTGLIPVFLRTAYGDDNYYAGIGTVFSIHNLKFQGRWALPAVVDITGLPEQIFTPDKLESYGEANYLKGGVVYANVITTVSRTYADEIVTPEGGEGLHGIMSARRDAIYGIQNGIDYEEYNPKTDVYLPSHFDAATFGQGKAKNKASLQRSMGLPVKDDVFLLGMVSRMTEQKGFDLLGCAMDELLAGENLQFVAVGTGEAQYENMLRYFAGKYPGKLRVFIGYEEELAHQIYGSCDAFLMPSLFEPSGLSQLMSLRYGTVPIVRETGGLRDTVEAYNEYEQTGTGFSFANYNAQEMISAVRYAMQIYYGDKQSWNGLIRRGMEKDFSWSVSAGEYEKLYEKLCGLL
ncbi:MAG: glycogen synthase GlgA [Roseburia sp.]